MTGITEEQAILYMTLGFMIIVGIWLIVLTALVLKRTKAQEKKEEGEEKKKEEEPEEEEAVGEEESEEEEDTGILDEIKELPKD